MVVLWNQSKNGTNYYVSRAGNSIRLYRNKVLHSQWNPRNPIKGHIWELFLLSSLPSYDQIKHVLVLGAGGGAVVNLVHYLFKYAKVDAIDLDDQHLYVANTYFKIDPDRCRLIHDDAVKWVRRQQSNQYDLIVEDLFTEKEGVPHRAVEASPAWIKTLLGLLTKQGSLVMNFADQQEWNITKEQLTDKKIHLLYRAAIAQHKSCDNRIIYLAKHELSAGKIKNQLQNETAEHFLKCWRAGIFSYRSLW
jgi:predicted membrane-bound spermidine synthase